MVVKVAMPQQFKLKVVPSLKGLLFPNQKEVHYIGGSEVLPPPLETERETEVIRRLGSESVSYTHLTLPTIYSV